MTILTKCVDQQDGQPFRAQFFILDTDAYPNVFIAHGMTSVIFRIWQFDFVAERPLWGGVPTSNFLVTLLGK